ncbi:MAG: hypothetical protein DRQ55_01065 [Planctomycetota bacterium]|nr:MAG: hypothetical protein DRQ55_01065 [Planctomycetota bacterium]
MPRPRAPLRIRRRSVWARLGGWRAGWRAGSRSAGRARLALCAGLAGLLGLAGCGATQARAGVSPDEAGGVPQVERRAWPHERCQLPLDAAVQLSQLPNGLRLAFVDLDDGSGELLLALHLAAGSLSEDEDERGAAHLLQHVAFSDEQALGARWLAAQPQAHGAHLSSAAGWHECVFSLRLQGDVGTQLEHAGAWFARLTGATREAPEASTARAIARASAEVDQESASAEEDTRASALRSASAALVAGSRLAQRGPFDPGARPTAQAFARWRARWLRPDLITVVLVGDLSGVDALAALTPALGALPRPPTAPGDADPGPPVTLAAPFVAREVPSLVSLQLTVASLKPAPAPGSSRAQLLDEVPLGLARTLLEARLRAVAAGGLPGVSVRAVDGEAGLSGMSLSMQCLPSAWAEALVVCRRVLDHSLSAGFADAEVELLVAQAVTALQRRAPRSSAQWLAELLALAAGSAVPMSPADAAALLGPALQRLDGESCRVALRRAWDAGSLSIQALGPLPVDGGAGLALRQAWERAATPDWAYASDPARRGAVTGRHFVADLGVHQLQLDNGVRVNLKPLPGASQVALRVVLGEGQLALPPERAAVVFAAQQLGALETMGLVQHDGPSLRRVLAARRVSASLSAGEDAFVLEALAPPEELGFALELLAATVREPGFHPEGLSARRGDLGALYAGLASQPRGPLLSEVLPRLFSGDPRFGLPPQSEVAAVSMGDIAAWVGPQFAEGPLELTLVGDFEPEQAEAALLANFGLLPQRVAQLRPYAQRRRVTLVSGLREDIVVSGPAPLDLLQIHLPTADGRDAVMRRRLSLLAVVLGGRLVDALQPLLGQQGRLDVSSSASQVFAGLGDLVLEVEPPPGTAPEALELCVEVLQRLAREGVGRDELARLMQQQLQAVAAQQGTPGYWLGVLGRCQREPARLDQARTLLSDYAAIDAAALSALAAEVLDWQAASVVLVQVQVGAGDSRP